MQSIPVDAGGRTGQRTELPKGTASGRRSWNASEWPLTHEVIKLKLLAQKRGRVSCVEQESRIHTLAPSCVKPRLVWGDGSVITEL